MLVDVNEVTELLISVSTSAYTFYFNQVTKFLADKTKCISRIIR